MAKYEIVCPTEKVVQAYNSTVKPMFEIIRHNIEQSRTLAELRDTLLPRLISGELRVTGAGVTQDL